MVVVFAARKLLCYCITLSCFIILLSLQSWADAQSSATSTHICGSTLDPSFCKSNGPTNNNSSANVYTYGRFYVRKSLSSARKFSSLIQKYLDHSKYLTVTAIRALQDCKVLAEFNNDFLLNSFQVVNGTSSVLPTLEADDVQTKLSAVLTNTRTCLDGLRETSSTWSVRNGISAPLANDTKLFSLSLAFFTKGWVSSKKKKNSHPHPHPKQLAFSNGNIPMRMSEHHRRVYETASRRKLLQTTSGDEQVLISDIVVVSQDGSGNFTTVNDAVAAAPLKSDGSNGYFLIYVTAGVYEEYVSISKNQRYLIMVGAGIDQTIITGNHSVVDGWTTFNSSTFAVVGQGFIGVNFTIQNTAGAIKHQAVALRNGADLSSFYSCSFKGYQDTLYVHSLRQFYRECDIYGTVDFIFGNAAVVFQNCNLHPRLPMASQFNAITAQGRTDPNQNTGISIQNCTITATDDLASSNTTIQTFLGRPWKLYSRTIYMQSYMDGSINSAGWHEWLGDLGLNTSYYAEYDNRGPGSKTSGRVNWPGFHIINAIDAANFTVNSFILGDDWIWQTGIPYTSGLQS